MIGLVFSLGLAQTTAASQNIAQFELQYGATDINAAIGNGGLTAGFSAQGELTVLRWPSPSYFQHVDFVSDTAPNARSEPHFGALPNMGSFAGVFVSPGPSDSAGTLVWARDEGWIATQHYLDDGSNQLITTLSNPGARITVTYTDTVATYDDVLVRNIEVLPDPGFTPTDLELVYFENFSPVLEKTAYTPTDETTGLATRDYALAMSVSLGALVHFSLPGRPADLLSSLAARSDPLGVDAFLSSEVAGQQGMFIVMGSDRPPDHYHCGVENAAPPGDALDQAAAGFPEPSPQATVHADGVLGYILTPQGGSIDMYITFGTQLSDATTRLTEARSRGGNAIRADEHAFWQSWLASANLPDTTDADRLRIAKRALLSTAVARDRQTGAIVSSISSQPPYNFDWPREAAFIDYALDVAGYHAWADQHRRLYATWQRASDGDETNPQGPSPAGTYSQNYMADGTPGGPIGLEIDEVGLTLWATYTHALWLTRIEDQKSYLNDMYDSISLSANFLTTCKDPSTHLQCAANEDDNSQSTVTLHGALPVQMGLKAAVAAATLLGGKGTDLTRWQARLDEINLAIDANFSDPAVGYVGGVTPLGDVGEIGPVTWMLWPGQFHANNDARMQAASTQIEDNYQPFFAQQNLGGSYFAKGIISLLLFDGPQRIGGVGNNTRLAQTKAWLDVLVKQVATRGTDHFGESFEYNGNDSYTNVTAIPHVWEGTLTYLALMAAYNPDTFFPPTTRTCGCKSAEGAQLFAAFLACAWLMRRVWLHDAGRRFWRK